MNEADAKKLLDLSEDEIMLSLGRIVIEEKFSQPQDPRKYISEARKWLKDNWEMIRKRVCGNKKIQEMIANNKVVDDTGLVITVCSLFSGYLEPAIAALVSGLVVRRGIASICSFS